jgi:hypothetical protein
MTIGAVYLRRQLHHALILSNYTTAPVSYPETCYSTNIPMWLLVTNLSASFSFDTRALLFYIARTLPIG